MKNVSKSAVIEFLIFFVNLLLIIKADKLNNNIRDINIKNNIKITLSNSQEINNIYLFEFPGNDIPTSVFLINLDGDKIKLVSVDKFYKNDNYNLGEEYTLILEWNHKINSMIYFFYSVRNLIEIDFSEFDASEVTSMGYLFYNCANLKKIIFGNINTSSLIEMTGIFYLCTSLHSIDLSHFNTSKVKNMDNLFYECTSLTSLDITNFDTSKVTSMGQMFYNCISLTSLDITNFNTSQVVDMNSFFFSIKIN